MTACAVEIGYVDGILQTCVVCPGTGAVAAVPDQIVYSARTGWNASARSITELDGDLYVQFTAPHCVGLVLGLVNERRGSDPRTVPYGFYIETAAGRETWRVIEGGVLKTAAVTRIPDTDVFRIERVGGIVTYLRNGRVIYRSETYNDRRMFVVSCMFHTNDGVD